MDRSRPPERQLRQPPVLHGCDGYRLAVQGRDIGDDDADGAAMWAGSVSIARALVLELHQVDMATMASTLPSDSRAFSQQLLHTYIHAHIRVCAVVQSS